MANLFQPLSRCKNGIGPKYCCHNPFIPIFEKKIIMANKLKMTGFARFFIFLLIATPLIYSGVSFYKGDHPLDALKRDFGIDLTRDKTEQVDEPSANRQEATREVKDLKEKLDFLREKNEDLEMENDKLKNRIKELEGQ